MELEVLLPGHYELVLLQCTRLGMVFCKYEILQWCFQEDVRPFSFFQFS